MTDAQKHTTPIFLFSMPRSGSTWLQRELCRQRAIMSAPEPWFLLPLLYLTRVEQTFTPYSSFLYSRAKQEMAQRGVDLTPHFETATRETAGRIFSELAQGAPFFLDKTPRYAHLAPQIVQLFPHARFVFLWRDPLDMGLSVLRSWGGRWDTLFRYQLDFVDGLRGMAQASTQLGNQAIHVTYEAMRADPTTTCSTLLTQLGIARSDTDARSDEELAALLQSDLIGDQSYSGKPATKTSLTRGNRRSLARLIENVPADFWECAGYDKQRTFDRLAQERVRTAPVTDAVSGMAAFLYTRNLYGLTCKLNTRRDAELGPVRHMLD